MRIERPKGPCSHVYIHRPKQHLDTPAKFEPNYNKTTATSLSDVCLLLIKMAIELIDWEDVRESESERESAHESEN